MTAVKSILDTDLYKLSMSYAYFSLYPLAQGVFEFQDRAKESWEEYPEIVEQFKMEVAKLTNIRLTDEEKEYCIKNITYIPKTYWEWLTTFRFKSEYFKPWLDEDYVFHCSSGEPDLPLYEETFYEIATLVIYSRLRNKYKGWDEKFNMKKALARFEEKIDFANRNNIPFSEFGTRRRYSYELQEEIIKLIKEKSLTCTGTSNVYFAMKYNLKPQGTVAHEFIMFHSAVFGYKRANYLSLEAWKNVYRGDLGTALIDTFTTPSFLRTLTKQQALLLTGYRQDSGDEYAVGNAIIKRLKEFGIDPKSKLLVFSNALDFDKANEIYEYFNGRIKVGFGIGTNITCDPMIDGFKPTNVVMKLDTCRLSDKDPWEKCIKISDDIGKYMGDEKEFEIAIHELHLDKETTKN